MGPAKRGGSVGMTPCEGSPCGQTIYGLARRLVSSQVKGLSGKEETGKRINKINTERSKSCRGSHLPSEHSGRSS